MTILLAGCEKTSFQPSSSPSFPAGLLLLQPCVETIEACNSAVWVDDQDGHYRRIPFSGDHLNVAHNNLQATYQSDEDIWLLDLVTGATRNLTHTPDCDEHDVTWSPDDNTIIFEACGGYPSDIYLLDIATGKRANLTNTPDVSESCFYTFNNYSASCYMGWWPQQPSLLIAKYLVNRSVQPGEPLWGACHTMNGECTHFPLEIPLNGKTYTVLDEINGVDHLPSLSPDGTLLAYDGGILYSLNTGLNQTIHPSEYGLMVEPGNETGDPGLIAPSWSPDGSQIAWIGHTNGDGDIGLYTFDLPHHEGHLLVSYRPYYATLSRGAPQSWTSCHMTWSPDGRWVTLSGVEWNEQEKQGDAFLWVIGSDGKTKRKFSKGDYDIGPPLWSPDSQTLIFTQDDRTSTGISTTLNRIKIQGWEMDRLDFPANVYPITWMIP